MHFNMRIREFGSFLRAEILIKCYVFCISNRIFFRRRTNIKLILLNSNSFHILKVRIFILSPRFLVRLSPIILICYTCLTFNASLIIMRSTHIIISSSRFIGSNNNRLILDAFLHYGWYLSIHKCWRYWSHFMLAQCQCLISYYTTLIFCLKFREKNIINLLSSRNIIIDRWKIKIFIN